MNVTLHKCRLFSLVVTRWYYRTAGHVHNTCYRAEINLRNSELYHIKLLPAVQT